MACDLPVYVDLASLEGGGWGGGGVPSIDAGLHRKRGKKKRKKRLVIFHSQSKNRFIARRGCLHPSQGGNLPSIPAIEKSQSRNRILLRLMRALLRCPYDPIWTRLLRRFAIAVLTIFNIFALTWHQTGSSKNGVYLFNFCVCSHSPAYSLFLLT